MDFFRPHLILTSCFVVSIWLVDVTLSLVLSLSRALGIGRVYLSTYFLINALMIRFKYCTVLTQI